MVKFEKLVPGMVLYDVHSQLAGNTTIREWGVWEAIVKSVDPGTRTSMVSWNSNPPKKEYGDLRQYRLSPPEWIPGSMFRPTRCHFCGERKADWHAVDCRHPKAIAARKKASK